MVKAIIFDCFGVIVTAMWAPFRETHFSHDPKLLREADDLTRAVDLGLISREDYRVRIAEMSGLSSAEIYHALEKSSGVDRRVMDLIRSLKTHYKIGMLSSIAPNRLEQFVPADDRAVFDVFALSYEMGHVKPEPEAYYIAAQRLGVAPEECLFVDDQEKNVFGAQRVGMKAVLYTNFTEFERDIEKLLQ